MHAKAVATHATVARAPWRRGELPDVAAKAFELNTFIVSLIEGLTEFATRPVRCSRSCKLNDECDLLAMHSVVHLERLATIRDGIASPGVVHS